MSRALLRRSNASTAAVCVAVAVTAGATIPAQAAGSSTPSTNPPTPNTQQVKSVSDQLAAASAAANAAATAVTNAAIRLPAAQGAVNRSQVVLTNARASQREAQANAAAARLAIAAQHQRVAVAGAQIKRIEADIAGLARATYIAGGETQELSMLLESQNPSEFADQLASVRRVAQTNTTAFARMTAARAALKAKLVELARLEAVAQARQNEADARAGEAVAANNSSLEARRQVASLLTQRLSAQRAAAVEKDRLRSLYTLMLVRVRQAEERAAAAARAAAKAAAAKSARKAAREAAKHPKPSSGSNSGSGSGSGSGGSGSGGSGGSTGTGNGGSGYIGGSGTRRSGRQAVAWAMRWIGGGSEYQHQCLRFVDDAYQPSGDRVGTAIAQWYRAVDAGVGHPGDRTPPIGAQVFWRSGNPARHIALYAGDGLVVTTDADGYHVGLVTMDYLDGWGPYLGWASPYYG